jgi:hypothetical protein
MNFLMPKIVFTHITELFDGVEYLRVVSGYTVDDQELSLPISYSHHRLSQPVAHEYPNLIAISTEESGRVSKLRYKVMN